MLGLCFVLCGGGAERGILTLSLAGGAACQAGEGSCSLALLRTIARTSRFAGTYPHRPKPLLTVLTVRFAHFDHRVQNGVPGFAVFEHGVGEHAAVPANMLDAAVCIILEPVARTLDNI